MNHQTISRRQGFTLVEIMIVVAIIALLAAIAVPNFMRARKRSQATLVLQELRILQDAIEQYTMESPIGAVSAGQNGGWIALQPYVKVNSRLYNSFNSTSVKDAFGNNYNGWQDTQGGWHVGVAASTFTLLSDVAPASFWSPYQ